MSLPSADVRVPAAPLSVRREHGDPCTIVLFGATGDLSRRKLFGAIYDLAKKRLVPESLTLVGVDRTPLDDAGFRDLVRASLAASDEVKNIDDAVWARLRERIFYVTGDLTAPVAYAEVQARLAALGGAPANRLFYLAVPPVIFAPIVQHLAASGLAPRRESPDDAPWVRVVVEKPFGDNLATARALNAQVLAAFAEHQVFRIDHYLGKETVQNILVFRAANAIFEPLWNRDHIAHVQITAAETVGVEGRGRYYERSGVVRDMFQNHLLQLFALTAMDLPGRMNAADVQAAKLGLLDAVQPIEAAVRAQYDAGSIAGKAVPGYREEPEVAPDSATPTYAAIRLSVDTDRWRGVPFYLCSGKRMARRTTEIAVQFRTPPYLMEGVCGPTVGDPVPPNLLIHRVQPDDGISLRFAAKIPGAALVLTPEIEVSPVDMSFNYADAFGAETHPAYESLLLDAMLGNALLFPRSDIVEAGWRITDPLLEAWDRDRPARLPSYPAGSWGPAEAAALLPTPHR